MHVKIGTPEQFGFRGESGESGTSPETCISVCKTVMPEHCESGGMHRCVERASQEKSAESRTSPETWISVCKRLAMRHKANMKHARPQETQGEPACAGICHPAICVWQ